MIPFLDFRHFLNLFMQMVVILRVRRLNRFDVQDENEILIMLLNSMTLILEYLRCVVLIRTVMKRRMPKKRKQLVKPHILLRLLLGYRSEFTCKSLMRMKWNLVKMSDKDY